MLLSINTGDFHKMLQTNEQDVQCIIIISAGDALELVGA